MTIMGLSVLKLVRWISVNVPGFRKLDGYKTYFGVAVLTVVYGFLYLVGLGELLPHLTWISGATDSLQSVIDVLIAVAEGLGWTFTAFGLLDKKAKRDPKVMGSIVPPQK